MDRNVKNNKENKAGAPKKNRRPDGRNGFMNKKKPEERSDEKGQKYADRRNGHGEDNRNSGRRPNRRREVVDKNTNCPYAKRCGGCRYIDTPYAEQLKIKRDYVNENIKEFCKLETIVGMDHPQHYRNKVHAVFTRDRHGNILAGTYQEKTHQVVDIESCYLDDQKADKIILTIKKLLPSFKIKTYDEDSGYGLFRHALIRIGKSSGEIMVVLVLASPIMPSKNNFVKALRKEHPEITTVIVNVNDKRTSMILGNRNNTIYGKGFIEDELCGKIFRISPSAFYQVNPEQTRKLYTKAIEFAGLTGKETVLDAYCGIGTIGIIASDQAKEVIGVELNRDAVRDAVSNAKRNAVKNIQFVAADAGEFMTEMSEESQGQVDVVFMDPPRAGSDEAFLKSVVQLAPSKVVYISCNPETLGRDLKYLTSNGYSAEKAVAYDMFPFTTHVESVILLHRKNI